MQVPHEVPQWVISTLRLMTGLQKQPYRAVYRSSRHICDVLNFYKYFNLYYYFKPT